MPPDLNSLPPSRSMSSSSTQPRAVPIPPRRDTPSPRSSPIGLANTATLNATELSRRSSINNPRGSPRLGRASERRRSIVAMNLNLNDPTIPSPGELSSSDHRASITHTYSSASPSNIGSNRVVPNGDPHHQRTPSLGEIHQELEQEQEAQVNRMLHMIRDQQLRLDQMRMQSEPLSHQNPHSTSISATAGPGATAILDDLSETEPSYTLPSNATPTHSQSPLHTPHTRLSMRSTSRSPARSTSYGANAIDFPPSPSLSHRDSLLETATARRSSNSLRDETAYYQAETATLTRENQMLRMRIRELERQLSDTAPAATGSAHGSHGANTPSISSPLVEGMDKRS